MINNDVFEYEVDNTYESAQELCGDSVVNVAMGDKNITTEDTVVINNIHLEYEEHESELEIGVDGTHPI